MSFPAARGWTHILSWLCGVTLAGAGCVHTREPEQSVFSVTEPSANDPVTAAMRVEPQEVRAGNQFEVEVRVRIAGGHYIYSTEKKDGPFTATELKLVLPDEVIPVGGWLAPEPNRVKGDEKVYKDSILFRRALRVVSNAGTGVVSIKGELLCQACTEELCWPPRKIGVSGSLKIVSRKE